MDAVRPKTMDEAIEWLLFNMTQEDLEGCRDEKFDNLIKYHHTFGQTIRNGFGMWTEAQQDFVEEVCSHAPRDEDKNLIQGPHPDVASQTILEALWTRLQARGN